MSSSSSPDTFADLTLPLRDGRRVGVMAVGPSAGFPVVHCHGSGSSRLEAQLLAPAATAAGVRLIGLDRPGIGCSDPKPGYRLLDWPDDVAQVADALGLARFAVQGVSAGGPFALACAHRLPHRLTACGLVSTIAPPDLLRQAGPASMRALGWLADHFPRALLAYARLVQRATGSDTASTGRYLARYAPRLGGADAQLLSDPATRRQVAVAMAESFRQGPGGNLEIVVSESRPWGFAVEQLGFAPVFLWHGERDRIAPIAPARLLARAIPHCTATFYPDDGHFSTVLRHAADILRTLTAPSPSPVEPARE
jgi:pimeloyl-ACP methyl ester carboxylesterase